MSQRHGSAAITSSAVDRVPGLRPGARVVVIGAGVAGLTAALKLAAQGLEVTVLERADTAGGKVRELVIAGAPIDAGPTVFTMRWVFDELFASIGENVEAHLNLKRLQILARHAWSEHERLDLYADRERTADAIGRFAGAAEARHYELFAQRAQHIYRTLEAPFIRSQRPSMPALIARAGWRGIGGLLRIQPFQTLWGTLGEHFRDPRVKQLFARYATYCGSSPFAAPATLMLVAHVEQEGVWTVAGGMHQLAQALARLAVARGAVLRFAAEASVVTTRHRAVTGVTLASGEHIRADAVIANTDSAAVSSGLLGPAVTGAVTGTARQSRSLSAVTWALRAEAQEFPLLRHNVFFSRDYSAEFEQIFRQRRLPTDPTVYVCAQDRDDQTQVVTRGSERLFCLINAPADGDRHDLSAAEIEQCEQRTFKQLERCGLKIGRRTGEQHITTPADFNRLFPGTGGALYGQATHGWQASFRRPRARTALKGLYLAGGSVHPGPGVPMAALSGRLAAASLLEDLDLMSRSRGMVMRGGTSMR